MKSVYTVKYIDNKPVLVDNGVLRNRYVNFDKWFTKLKINTVLINK